MTGKDAANFVPFDFVAHKLYARRLRTSARCLGVGTSTEPFADESDTLLGSFCAELSAMEFEERTGTRLFPAASQSDWRETLAAIPRQNKAQILERRHLLRSKPAAGTRVYQDSTSGTTDRPFVVYRPAHSIQRESVRLWHILSYYGFGTAADSLQSLVYISHYAGATAFEYEDRTLRPLRILKRPFDGAASPPPLAESDGTFALCATPSSHASALRRPDFPDRHPRLALASGEGLPATLRSEMAARYQCPVFTLYLMREFGVLGFECRCALGMHLFDTDFVFGVLDDGQLIVTDTTNTFEPYINYETGDHGIVRQLVNPCACGSRLPLLLDFSGRPYGKPISAAAV